MNILNLGCAKMLLNESISEFLVNCRSTNFMQIVILNKLQNTKLRWIL
jgi:hypothetical protein